MSHFKQQEGTKTHLDDDLNQIWDKMEKSSRRDVTGEKRNEQSEKKMVLDGPSPFDNAFQSWSAPCSTQSLPFKDPSLLKPSLRIRIKPLTKKNAR